MTTEPLPMPEGARVVTTELGLEVPTVSVPGRRRTNEDWQRIDPETYETVLECILGLELNVSRLAHDYAPLRKNADGTQGITEKSMRRLIGVMIQNDPRLGIAKFRDLKKLKLELLEAEMIDKVSELGDKATKADLLGAAAMAMKLSRDTLNAQGGAAVVIVKHEHSITVDTETQRRREEMGRRLAERRAGAQEAVLVQPLSQNEEIKLDDQVEARRK